MLNIIHQRNVFSPIIQGILEKFSLIYAKFRIFVLKSNLKLTINPHNKTINLIFLASTRKLYIIFFWEVSLLCIALILILSVINYKHNLNILKILHIYDINKICFKFNILKIYFILFITNHINKKLEISIIF